MITNHIPYPVYIYTHIFIHIYVNINIYIYIDRSTILWIIVCVAGEGGWTQRKALFNMSQNYKKHNNEGVSQYDLGLILMPETCFRNWFSWPSCSRQAKSNRRSLSLSRCLSVFLSLSIYIHIYMYVWMDWNADTSGHYYVMIILDILWDTLLWDLWDTMWDILLCVVLSSSVSK